MSCKDSEGGVMAMVDDGAVERYRQLGQEAHDAAMMYRGKLEAAEQRITELDAQEAELKKEVDRHKNMFMAACEQLGAVQEALGTDVVGIEAAMVMELSQERDALAAHVERLVSTGTEFINADDVEDEDDSASIQSRFNDALVAAEATFRRIRRNAKTLREQADKAEAQQ